MGRVEVCVVHLVWAPLGTAPLERFIESYRGHSAGVEHRLLAVFKEFHDAEKLAAAENVLADVPHASLEMPKRKLDLAAYRAIAEVTDASHFYFLNSESLILDEGWLAKPFEHLRAPGIGLVGATGSHESFYSATPARAKLLYKPFFPPFPNPHIRTNAFMMARETILGLDWRQVRRKSAAFRLESGKNSVTRQVVRLGLAPLVVGRDGHAYERARWRQSNTFRSGGQSNLLVSDKRTRDFDEGSPDLRRWLSWRAWGDEIIPPPPVG